MGAFYLSPKQFITEKTKELFRKKGFSNPFELMIGERVLLLYQKQLLTVSNYKKFADGFIMSVGTVFYNGMAGEQCLEEIHEGFISHSLDPLRLVGGFFIMCVHQGRNLFLTDQTGIQNVYFSRAFGIISSSQLAILTTLGEVIGKQSVNRMAICESLTTGNLIGPDTIIDGIERYENCIHKDLPGLLPMLPYCDNEREILPALSFNEALEDQKQALYKYFFQCEALIEQYGVISGITGGFDSRLLYLIMKKFTRHYRIYSTFRETPDKELFHARKFAEAAGEMLYSVPYRTPNRMAPEELQNMLAQNFYFNDGVIRTHQLWLEEIKSKEYLLKLYGNFRIGFSGIGGEQYRNGGYLIRKRYSFASWISNELIDRLSPSVFLDSKNKAFMIEHMKGKIARLLKIPLTREHITFTEIKRYYNEIWNPANRTVRNNVENQLAFFLTPFADYQVSHVAYQAIPFLGNGPDFEMVLIRDLAPELAGCQTNYGFAVSDKVSPILRLVPYMKAMLGLKIFNRLYAQKKRGRESMGYYHRLLQSHPWLEEIVRKNERLNLPIRMEKLIENDFLSPLLIESGYFLFEMERYLQL